MVGRAKWKPLKLPTLSSAAFHVGLQRLLTLKDINPYYITFNSPEWPLQNPDGVK